jgi:hypothetical protein
LAALEVAVSHGGIEVKGCIFDVLIQFQIVRAVRKGPELLDKFPCGSARTKKAGKNAEAVCYLGFRT